jgi:hypothetical protein
MKQLTAAQKKVLAKWGDSPKKYLFLKDLYFKGTKQVPKTCYDYDIITIADEGIGFRPNLGNPLVYDFFYPDDLETPIIKKPFCETVNDAVNFSKPDYTLCDFYRLAFLGHLRGVPTPYGTECFLKDIEAIIPRVQSESYLILVKESLKA